MINFKDIVFHQGLVPLCHTYYVPNLHNTLLPYKSTLEKLTKWVQSGGTLIAIDNALRSFADKKGFSLKKKKSEKQDGKAPNLTAYAKLERERTQII